MKRAIKYYIVKSSRKQSNTPYFGPTINSVINYRKYYVKKCDAIKMAEQMSKINLVGFIVKSKLVNIYELKRVN